MSGRSKSAASSGGDSLGEPNRNSVATPASAVSVLRDVARDHVNQVVFFLSALVVTFAYSMVLTFAYTQRFSWANWHYLNTRIVVWSVVLALAMATVVVLQVHAIRRVKVSSSSTGALGGLAFVGSILPSLLCCTPIIPTALAFVGFSTLSVYGTTGTLQHFFAVYETQFFVVSLLLVALTAWWSLRGIAKSSCATEGCDVPWSDDANDVVTKNTALTKGSQ